MMRRTIGTVGVAGTLIFSGTSCAVAQAGRAKTYEIRGAVWFDGRTFARKQL